MLSRRKLSLLSPKLVVGLVGVRGLVASRTESINLSRGSGTLELNVHNSVSFDGPSFDPTSATVFGTTNLKVVSGGQYSLTLSIDSNYP